MTTLPHLTLDDLVSPFDEAVILIDGREEWTITIECDNAREIAEQIVRLVNNCRRCRTDAVQTYEEAMAPTTPIEPQAPYQPGPGVVLWWPENGPGRAES